MENLELLLIAGLIKGAIIFFVIIPTFVFLLCVRRINGKWHIKKDGVAPYLYALYGSKAMCTPPENMCQLHCDVIITELATITLLCVIALFGGLISGMICLIISAVIEYPKTFLVLLLSIKFIAVIVWKTRVYTKTEVWRNQKEKTKDQINKLFQVFQKASNKVCIKFENV